MRLPTLPHRLAMLLSSAACCAALVACASTPGADLPPLTLVPQVDLPRFMGDWYVIASIPTFIEKGGQNAKERYALNADGTIATVFTFNADSPTGPLKEYDSKAFVLDGGRNATWGQQYVWPLKADYRISYLSADYAQTVITREKRDHAWIMARSPSMSDADLARLTAFVGAQGYDVSKLVRVPQAGASRP